MSENKFDYIYQLLVYLFMDWEVRINAKAYKNLKKLPKGIEEIFQLLLREIQLLGPMRGKWPNYGKLSKNCHHCHLQKGNPTYVAIWRANKKERVVEVTYVGTHEKAHYDRYK